MTNALDKLLAEKGVLLADGATGTNLFAMGLESGDAPELWNIDQPDKIKALHRGFVEAGSDVILTNSFGGTRHRLKLHGAEGRVHELNAAAARIARRIADAAARPVVVAGSVGPTGELLQPLGALSFEDAVQAFAEQMAGLKAGGADVLWIETMSAPEEIRAAVDAAIATGLPYVYTASFDTAGRTMMGMAPKDIHGAAGAQPVAPAAVGLNCGVGASDALAALLDITNADGQATVVIKANCGIPEFRGSEIHYSGTPELMADYARLAIDAGARIIGGCCGTQCDHLSAMRAAIDTHQRGARPELDDIVARVGAMRNKPANDTVPRQRSRRERRRARG